MARALAGEPLDLLSLASTLLAVVDPRARDPFERGPDVKRAALTRDELVASFLDVDLMETTALLAVIAEMAGDDLLRTRIHREVARRSHSLPDFLTGVGDVNAYRTVEMVHVLRDGDNVIVGARLPSGEELSSVVYIDHNLGTVVKDAFVVPEPIGDLIAFMREKTDEPDTSWNDIDPADARVRITEAIDSGAMTYPPFETDTWPAARPLVEWIARLLPGGGTGYARPEWSEESRDDLTERFLASRFGAALGDEDDRGLLDSMLWFGCDYGPGDPMRWSPVAVEIFLDDWVPRKIVADATYLSRMPALLRAFVRFCHDERGIRPALTAETLAAVDEYEPDYQRTIRSPRPQGPAALLAAIGALDPDGPWATPAEEPLDYRQIMLETLCRAVGSEEALDRLDDDALPDEPFTWHDIPADVHERVSEVIGVCDRCTNELLDVEYRTACRRLLARVARGDPNVFRRRARADTAGAAVCWIVGKANELFSPSGGGMLVKDLTAHFGLHQGGVSQRATVMLKAGGFGTGHYGSIDLGSPDYLVSSRRRRIIERRDTYRAMEHE